MDLLITNLLIHLYPLSSSDLYPSVYNELAPQPMAVSRPQLAPR